MGALLRFSPLHRAAPLVVALSLALSGCAADGQDGRAAFDGALAPSGSLDAGTTTTGGEQDGALQGSPPASAPASDASAGTQGDAAADAAQLVISVEGEPGRLAGITAGHNAARARVLTMPPLAPLEWSPSIAALAQAYADQLAAGCANALEHSTLEQRRGLGENLASFSSTGGNPAEPTGSATRVVALWESELRCYTYGPFAAGVNATCSASCEAYGGCGHYTQMVWRQTQRIGCGLGECTDGKTRRSYWVCHYDPPGNYLGVKPY